MNESEPVEQLETALAALRTAMDVQAPVRLTGAQMEAHYLEILRRALRSAGMRLKVEALQKRLKALASFDELLRDKMFRGPRRRAFFEEWLDRIKDLWNYTPRPQLEGKRPTECFEELIWAGGTEAEFTAVPLELPSDFNPYTRSLQAPPGDPFWLQ